MYQDDLRNKLIQVIRKGLPASKIASSIDITTIDLSRFKNGKIGLVDTDAERLEAYLDKVVIP